ncbi:MAG: hypothetical protein OEL88_05830 [Sterolibacteriaceae bacterium MAG5]|nr:hypothetical protein [Candidatus Nitricoxidireducens bremensis]
MKIASANVALQGRHFAETRTEKSESLRSWIGSRRPDFEGRETAGAGPRPTVQISESARLAQSAETQSAGTADATDSDPFVAMLRVMLEWITGEPVKIFRPEDFFSSGPPSVAAPSRPASRQAAPGGAGFGIEYDFHAVREETEETRFSAAGMVRTTDGREIGFRLEAVMQRYYREETNISVRVGDAQRKDPLVINFAGTAAQLSNQRFRFDLTGDGNAEDIPLLASGSGYLALDLNLNGRIDSGAELFGPASGSGFAELDRYDDDRNGWIDENDAVFSRLGVWTPDSEGKGELATLKERNVGAIYLGRTDTPFELRGAGNEDLGGVRESGIFLTESGTAGTVQEIDLTL